ncbi:hypothetical protein [Bradyrhizobium sp. 188]|uniref:hypothetical protein n=1 Tax=Bradyrhizobium sp. 188 TaxID=2782656 RepID=UPI001FFB3F1F|nr:hypothetical protein [Bradyrhizobium sp. 188]MCK1501508.1 hypothetical protein [Bradyrhizobium sp. 188]
MATTDRRGVSVDATDTPIAGGPNPGLAMKAPARVATTTNVTLSGLQTIDGVALADGDRVLVTGQTDGRQNGLYNASSGPWTRTIDASSNDEWASGLAIRVASGTTRGGYVFRVTTADPIVVDTSAINFSAAVSAPQFTGGTLSGATIDNSNTVALKDSLFTLQDDGDATKQAKFQLAGIASGQTRAFALPDANTTLVGTDVAQTLSNKSIDGANNTLTNIAIASLVAIGAATLVGNPTAAAAHPEEFTIQSLAELLSPHFASDFILAYDHSSGAFRRIAPKNLAPQFCVDTIAALKALDKTSHDRVQVNSYYAIGDCRPRVYWLDTLDTSSADNNGSIIVATDGGRWKLLGAWTVKTFGAKADGTDQTTAVTAAINASAAVNVPLEFDDNFSVSAVVISGKAGLHLIGRGGLIGIASSAQTAVLQFINCTDVTINGRFVINGAYNTNYTYGFWGGTNAAGQDFQKFDITNPIVVGCKTAWGFGSTIRPDDDVAAVNIRGGYTFGCPQFLRATGTQTVIQLSSANIFSEYGSGNASWQTLPAATIEAEGATVIINGGAVLCTSITHDCAFKITAVAGASGNQYGNITVVGPVMEVASALCFTDNKSLTAPTYGAFTLTGSRFVLTNDTAGGAIQTDGNYAGKIVVVGNTGFAPNARTQLNANVSNASCAVTVDMQSFGVNCLQGYAGLSGGIQTVIGDPGWTSYTPTVTAQSGSITTIGSKTARYQRRGKTVILQGDIQITTAGTAAQGMLISLPFTSASNNYIGAAYSYSSAKSGAASIIPSVSGNTVVNCSDSTGATFFANGSKVSFEIEFEMA